MSYKAALGLKSATNTISTAAASAPTPGQVLTATSATTATWQTPAGGGGTAINTWAWVETAGNGGNDGTGVVGNMSKPFATMQAAYDAGGKCQFIGPGTFAGITLTGVAIELSFMGSGKGITTISLLKVINDASSLGVTAQDLGGQSAYISLIETTGSNAAEAGLSPLSAGAIVLYNVYAHTLIATGGDAVDADAYTAVQDGANGGDIYTYGYCDVIGTITANGGKGSNAYNDGLTPLDGAAGGPAGSVIVVGSLLRLTSITIVGGVGGEGTSGGNAGLDGEGGNIVADTLRCGTVTLDGYTPGNLTIYASADINNVSFTTQASDGNINGHGVFISSIASGSPNVFAVMSNINATSYP